MIVPVFKTGEWQVCPVTGAFDSHTLPPFANEIRNNVAKSAYGIAYFRHNPRWTHPINWGIVRLGIHRVDPQPKQ